MNDFSELETDLKRLRAERTSADLVDRVGRSLQSSIAATPTASVQIRRKVWEFNWLPLGLGLAAAAGFLVLARFDVEKTAPKQTTLASITPAPRLLQSRTGGDLLPAGTTQVVYDRRDEGLLFVEGAPRPVRRVRTQSRETLQWRNPSSGASLRVSYPREEVSLIPAAGQ